MLIARGDDEQPGPTIDNLLAKLNILSKESDGVWLTYFEDPKGLMTGHGQEYYMHELSRDDIKHTIKVKLESPSDELSFE